MVQWASAEPSFNPLAGKDLFCSTMDDKKCQTRPGLSGQTREFPEGKRVRMNIMCYIDILEPRKNLFEIWTCQNI